MKAACIILMVIFWLTGAALVSQSAPIYQVESREVYGNNLPISDVWGTPTFIGTSGDSYVYEVTRELDFTWNVTSWAITQGPNEPPPDPPGYIWVVDGSLYTALEYPVDYRNSTYRAWVNIQVAPLAGDSVWNCFYTNDTTGTVYTEETTYYALMYVPEPSTMLLLGLGLAGLAVVRRKFNK